ncbi:AsnC family transcriptional regulator [Ruegeria sp. ANG-S4]|nr:AsnC family transcriptional regulator [Ruegeria sp. ANG-S4]
MKMDRTNKRILALLQNNARLTATAIGKEIGLSRPAVQDRITAMENQGVIRGYHASLGEAAQLTHALMFVTIAQRPCAAAIEWLQTLDGVDTVFSLSGEIDAVVSVSVPSTRDLSNLSDRLLGSKYVSAVRTSIVLSRSMKRSAL